jgi:hypothetical protein
MWTEVYLSRTAHLTHPIRITSLALVLFSSTAAFCSDALELLNLSLACPLEPYSTPCQFSVCSRYTISNKGLGDESTIKIAVTSEGRTHIVDRNEVRTHLSTEVYEASLSKLRKFFPHELRPPTNIQGHGGFWRLDIACEYDLPDSETCISRKSRTTYQGAGAHAPQMSEGKEHQFQLSFCDEENAKNAKAALEELISAAKAALPPSAPSVPKDTLVKNSKVSRQAKTKGTPNNGDPITSITINTEPIAK